MSERTISELRADIATLEKAYREIAMGKRTAKMSYNGNSVEYTPGDLEAVNRLLWADRTELSRRTIGGRGPGRVLY